MADYKFVRLTKADKVNKKYMVVFANRQTGREKKIYFGSAGMSDYTIHKDNERRMLYLDRHRKREDWGVSGVMTAGWWSRWYLWENTSKTTAKKEIMMKLKTYGYL